MKLAQKRMREQVEVQEWDEVWEWAVAAVEVVTRVVVWAEVWGAEVEKVWEGGLLAEEEVAELLLAIGTMNPGPVG